MVRRTGGGGGGRGIRDRGLNFDEIPRDCPLDDVEGRKVDRRVEYLEVGGRERERVGRGINDRRCCTGKNCLPVLLLPPYRRRFRRRPNLPKYARALSNERFQELLVTTIFS